MFSHAFLILSCISLLAVIAAQDWLVPALRNQTISSGLTGPMHVLLDAVYVPVALSVALGFSGHPAMEVLAGISAAALILVAVTNTAWAWVDRITKGKHSLWHSRFTLVVFVSVLLLEVIGDHGTLWGFTALNIIVPASAYAYFHLRPTNIDGVVVAASPAAEKLYVLGLCVWLIAWAL